MAPRTVSLKKIFRPSQQSSLVLLGSTEWSVKLDPFGKPFLTDAVAISDRRRRR
jgi:hypothetical protein